MNSILNIILNVSAATSSQQLIWQLITIDKLDHLKSHSFSTSLGVAEKSWRGSCFKQPEHDEGPWSEIRETALREGTA